MGSFKPAAMLEHRYSIAGLSFAGLNSVDVAHANVLAPGGQTRWLHGESWNRAYRRMGECAANVLGHRTAPATP
jgi:hypothetical protein